jgi:hypothetical protein
MPYVPIKLPAGISRPGTLYDARGRWYDASLVRWHEGAMQPVGGWSALGSVPGAVRGALAWRGPSDVPRLALGTSGGAYVYTEGGAVSTVTPGGFTPG